MRNALYYGDNLLVLREHIPDESVDLVYLSGENTLYVFGGLAAAESNTLWRVQPN